MEAGRIPQQGRWSDQQARHAWQPGQGGRRTRPENHSVVASKALNHVDYKTFFSAYIFAFCSAGKEMCIVCQRQWISLHSDNYLSTVCEKKTEHKEERKNLENNLHIAFPKN